MKSPLQLVKAMFFWLPILAQSIGKTVDLFGSTLGTQTARVGGYWKRLSHFRQNLVIGLIIALAVHFAHDTSMVRETEDWAIDWMNRLQADSSLMSPTANPPPQAYTYIDMDETSYKIWGEPYHFPRNKLVQLIQYAVAGGAKQIVVDVDLSRPGTDSAAANALKGFIESYPEDGPHLILMRGFQPENENTPVLPVTRNAYFGNQLGNPRIHWAQPLFSLDRKDGRIRRWRLVEAVCSEGKPTWLPSPQLLASTLSSKESAWEEIEKKLNKVLPNDCTGELTLDRSDSLAFEVDARHLDLQAKGFHQRVIYSFTNKIRLGNDELGYLRFPAHLVTESESEHSSELVAKRTVIIGASHQDSRDIHQTPVGSMSGALIILNAIKSLDQFGQLHAVPLWIKVLLEIAMIAAMAWLFSRFGSLGGVMLTGAVMMAFLVPFSFYFFHYGIWVDLAAPILGMQLHYTVADYEDAVRMRRRLRKLEEGKNA